MSEQADAREATSTNRGPARAWAFGLLFVQPLVVMYSSFAPMASDGCLGSDSRALICTGTGQALAAFVPMVGSPTAAFAALFLQAHPSPRVRDRGVLGCWLLALGCIVVSMVAIGQQPR